jgi:hypothetical protein
MRYMQHNKPFQSRRILCTPRYSKCLDIFRGHGTTHLVQVNLNIVVVSKVGTSIEVIVGTYSKFLHKALYLRLLGRCRPVPINSGEP